MILRRHNRCRGIVLFRWKRRQVEIWFCPKREEIEPHKHNNIDSTIVLLAGDMWGRIGDVRDGECGRVKRWTDYYVPAGMEHTATVGRFALFLNFEKWINDVPVTSAATDFSAV